MNTGTWKCGEVDQPIIVFLFGIAADGVFFLVESTINYEQ
jgi:hypothetical protein